MEDVINFGLLQGIIHTVKDYLSTPQSKWDRLRAIKPVMKQLKVDCYVCLAHCPVLRVCVFVSVFAHANMYSCIRHDDTFSADMNLLIVLVSWVDVLIKSFTYGFYLLLLLRLLPLWFTSKMVTVTKVCWVKTHGSTQTSRGYTAIQSQFIINVSIPLELRLAYFFNLHCECLNSVFSMDKKIQLLGCYLFVC